MFSFQLPKVLASRYVRPFALLAVAALAAPGAAMADSQWASVGSTGVVDEACQFSVMLNDYEARLMPGLLSICTIRYQVVDTYNTPTPINLALGARILDNVAGARVDVRLRSYNKLTGATATVTSFNSDAPPVPPGPVDAAGFRPYRSAGCIALNFGTSSYWVEVDLVRFSLVIPPAVAMVNLFTPC
ncbi:hypothetical protein NHH88_02695 [Oxalobacteraceae bacterium OTU3CAMAD1]|jgi:hypothetical protein|nr:hypothetical protein NHH88_02695 [Oxalobacteraceae bacterium OTU3CAMAD1]